MLMNDCSFFSAVKAQEDDEPTVDDDLGKSRDGSRTDDEVVQRYVSFFFKNRQLHGNCAILNRGMIRAGLTIKLIRL